MFPYIIASIIVIIFLICTLGIHTVSYNVRMRAHNKHVAWMISNKLTGYVLYTDTTMSSTIEDAYHAYHTYGGPLTIIMDGKVYDHAY